MRHFTIHIAFLSTNLLPTSYVDSHDYLNALDYYALFISQCFFGYEIDPSCSGRPHLKTRRTSLSCLRFRTVREP
jgi:hypothetical protein